MTSTEPDNSLTQPPSTRRPGAESNPMAWVLECFQAGRLIGQEEGTYGVWTWSTDPSVGGISKSWAIFGRCPL